MVESLMFFAFIGVILYVIFWAMIKDDGQTDWWEDYIEKPEDPDAEKSVEKWKNDK